MCAFQLVDTRFVTFLLPFLADRVCAYRHVAVVDVDRDSR